MDIMIVNSTAFCSPLSIVSTFYLKKKCCGHENVSLSRVDGPVYCLWLTHGGWDEKKIDIIFAYATHVKSHIEYL